jgi:ribosomal protein S20
MMKNNTNESKEHLVNALRNLPNDFTFSDVRFHLKTALNKLEAVEAKRINRESQQTSGNNWVMANNELMHPEVAKKVFSQLNAMIGAEKLRLEEIRKKKEIKNADDDIQSLLG